MVWQRYCSGNMLVVAWVYVRAKVKPTVESKANQCQNADDDRAQDLCTYPWIYLTTPAETDEEEDAASDEEENADEVEFFKRLPLSLAVDVKLLVCWRVVQKLVQHDGYHTENDAKVVTPAPSLSRVVDKLASNDGTKNCEWQAGHEHKGDNRTTLLVWYQLTEDDSEGQLAGCCNTIARIGCNEGFDTVCRAADDVTYDTENCRADYHPLSPEDVRQTANKEEADCRSEDPDCSYPAQIW